MTHPTTTDSSLFYYDGRQKVVLDLDTTQCVVDRSKIKAHLDEQRLSVICTKERKLRYELYLLPRSILTSDELARFENLKLIEPVFAAAGGHVVVTEEIFCSKGISPAIIDRANALGISPCKQSDPDLLVVESGRALDVLAIANRLTEDFPGASFTPLWIRLMKNPRP